MRILATEVMRTWPVAPMFVKHQELQYSEGDADAAGHSLSRFIFKSGDKAVRGTPVGTPENSNGSSPRHGPQT